MFQVPRTNVLYLERRSRACVVCLYTRWLNPASCATLSLFDILHRRRQTPNSYFIILSATAVLDYADVKNCLVVAQHYPTISSFQPMSVRDSAHNATVSLIKHRPASTWSFQSHDNLILALSIFAGAPTNPQSRIYRFRARLASNWASFIQRGQSSGCIARAASDPVFLRRFSP